MSLSQLHSLLSLSEQVHLAVDHFLSLNTSSILLYVPVTMVMLYVHPDPKPATIIYHETVSLMGVTGGVVLTYSLFPSPIPALMETSQGEEGTGFIPSLQTIRLQAERER